MRNAAIALVIIAAAGLIGFAVVRGREAEQPAPASKSETETNYRAADRKTNLRQATLKIDGMFCAGCAVGAEYALKEKAGVLDASVDYESENGRVVYDPSRISKEEIVQAVKPYTAVITKDAPLK